jgi:hypothetical protein
MLVDSSEFDDPWLGKRFAIQIGEQGFADCVVADEVAAINIAIADPVLQRNAPLPTCIACGRAGVRCNLFDARTGDGHGAVGGEVFRPIDIAGFQRTFDQQSVKARTVYKQIRFNAAAIFHLDSFDKPALAILKNARDLAFPPRHACRFGIFAQEQCIEPGIEMKGVGYLRQG